MTRKPACALAACIAARQKPPRMYLTPLTFSRQDLLCQRCQLPQSKHHCPGTPDPRRLVCLPAAPRVASRITHSEIRFRSRQVQMPRTPMKTMTGHIFPARVSQTVLRSQRPLPHRPRCGPKRASRPRRRSRPLSHSRSGDHKIRWAHRSMVQATASHVHGFGGHRAAPMARNVGIATSAQQQSSRREKKRKRRLRNVSAQRQPRRPLRRRHHGQQYQLSPWHQGPSSFRQCFCSEGEKQGRG